MMKGERFQRSSPADDVPRGDGSATGGEEDGAGSEEETSVQRFAAIHRQHRRLGPHVKDFGTMIVRSDDERRVRRGRRDAAAADVVAELVAESVDDGLGGDVQHLNEAIVTGGNHVEIVTEKPSHVDRRRVGVFKCPVE